MQRTSYVQTPKITYRLIRYRTMTHRKHKTEFLRPKREKKINVSWERKLIKTRENHNVHQTEETIPNEEVD